MTVEIPSSPAQMQPLVQIGDISVDQSWVHTTQVPVSRQDMVTDAYARVEYARALTANARR